MSLKLLYSLLFLVTTLSAHGGLLVTWGDSSGGGDSSGADLSSGVSTIYSTSGAFAALKSDGSVVTWGYSSGGGDSSGAYLSSDVYTIYSTDSAFAAILNDTDGNGVPDSTDAFPNDPTESVDTDSDNIGDNSDEFPNIPTQDLVNAIESNPTRYNLYSTDDIRDLRPGSTMIEVSGNQATVQLQMEQSSDLQTWEDKGDPTTMTIPADADTKFFRFKMVD